MSIFLLIASILMWIGALVMLPSRPVYSPGLSFIGLLGLSFCNTDGVSWLQINNTMLLSWISITIVVIIATMLQPLVIRRQTKGMAYMIGGAFVGLAIGLLGFTVTTSISMLYGIMIVATAAGIFFGFLVYSNTPGGRDVGISSGRFFPYLLAKGFPTAVTVMQIGLVLVLLIVQYDLK